jgi:hypothetical protein
LLNNSTKIMNLVYTTPDMMCSVRFWTSQSIIIWSMSFISGLLPK